MTDEARKIRIRDAMTGGNSFPRIEPPPAAEPTLLERMTKLMYETYGAEHLLEAAADYGIAITPKEARSGLDVGRLEATMTALRLRMEAAALAGQPIWRTDREFAEAIADVYGRLEEET